MTQDEIQAVALRERLRRAFDADSVAEKNLAIRAAYDFIAALDAARGDTHNDILSSCQLYLKDGETPAECIKRNRDDSIALMELLAAERVKVSNYEKTMAAISEIENSEARRRRLETASEAQLIDYINELEGKLCAALDAARGKAEPFQTEVRNWMLACFGADIAADQVERADRFVEEALELAQTMPGFTADRAHALVDYVFGRPVGEPAQEVGGVMVTLAALCNTAGIDTEAAARTELARVWTKVEAIRAKQAAKPTGAALPIAHPPADRVAQVVEWLRRENGLCDCHARCETECGCGAWDDWKTKPLLQIADAIERGEPFNG